MIETPCIGVCSTVYGDDICRGCHRSFDEVIRWNAMSAQEQAQVWGRLNERAACFLKDKVEILDVDKLDEAIARFSIRVTPFHSPAYRAYLLTRLVGSQVEDWSACGLLLLTPIVSTDI